MALFHLPLFTNKKCRFYQLMGTGKNGTFDKTPDITRWAIFSVHEEEHIQNVNVKMLYGRFIQLWISFFAKETLIIQLNPIAAHGTWNKKTLYKLPTEKNNHVGQIATITRATIRLTKLAAFWKNVSPVAQQMKRAKGLVFSAGIGEVPWIKQATFSIWTSEQHMKDFAYHMKEHREVIKTTRKDKWYSEDMFIRFSIVNIIGNLDSFSPLSQNT